MQTRFFNRAAQGLLCLLLSSLPLEAITASSPDTIPIHQSIEELNTQRKVDQLLLLIQKRLTIMHEVARTKWNHNLPIEDRTRERQILNALAEQASKQGLDEKWMLKFFEAQIEAAKLVQTQDFMQWRLCGMQKFEATLDLKNDLRVYIDTLNAEMIALLAHMHTDGSDKQIAAFVLPHPLSVRSTENVEQKVWQVATEPLFKIQLAPPS